MSKRDERDRENFRRRGGRERGDEEEERRGGRGRGREMVPGRAVHRPNKPFTRRLKIRRVEAQPPCKQGRKGDFASE